MDEIRVAGAVATFQNDGSLTVALTADTLAELATAARTVLGELRAAERAERRSAVVVPLRRDAAAEVTLVAYRARVEAVVTARDAGELRGGLATLAAMATA
jgi:hypothetical protein